MTWLAKKLKAYIGPEEQPVVPTVDESAKQTIEYFKSAQQALGEAEQRRAEAREVVTSLSKLRSRNHFGESIHLAMMPRER